MMLDIFIDTLYIVYESSIREGVLSPKRLKENSRRLYMARNEKTSRRIAKIASKGLRNPGSLSKKQVQALSGSVLTQAPDKKAQRPSAPRRK
jgi:hypothetical protein